MPWLGAKGCCRDAPRPRGSGPCPGWGRTGCCPGAGWPGAGHPDAERPDRRHPHGRREPPARRARCGGRRRPERPGPDAAAAGSGRSRGRRSRGGRGRRGRGAARRRSGRRGRRRARGGGAGAGAAGAGAAGAAAGAAGAGAAAGAAAGVAGAGRVAGAFLAAAGASALGASAGNFSLYLRTTGVSIVELALLTYSPMPFRRSRRTLLVTPSSLASALTRTLATFLLSRSVLCCADRRYSWGVLIAEYSSGAHQRQTRFRFLLSDGGSCSWALTQSSTAVWSGGVLLRSARPNARRRTARSRHETVRVQPCATPRTTALGVRQDDKDAVHAGSEDHSQECRPAIRPTTPDAGAHRVAGPESSPVGPHQSTA